MNIDDLTYGEMKNIAALMGAQVQAAANEEGDGRPVIVRSVEAGVLFGLFAGRCGSTIKLTNARQMWRWKAAKGGTLVDCAKYGVDGSGCKFSEAAVNVQVFNACALLDCSPDAAETIEAVSGGVWA